VKYTKSAQIAEQRQHRTQDGGSEASARTGGETEEDADTSSAAVVDVTMVRSEEL